jgi:putative peptidoglycan lipid II flippase
VPNYSYALSWGVFVAGILQFLWVSTFTIKSGFLLYPQMPKFNDDMKKFFRKLIPGIIGANVMQINLLVDSIFASMIAGAVSYLYYADRINQLPLAMIGIAIGIALLPSLSRKIKANEIDSAIRLQNAALEVGLILVIPATLALTVLAFPIISSLFERGKFTSDESFFVARALMFYSFGLPSYVLVKVMEPAFFSRGDTKTPMKIAFACLINNAIFNLIFFTLGFGYVGIVLSSVASTYLNLTILITTLIRKKHFHFEKDFAKKMILILIPSFLMALTLFIMREHFYQSEYFGKITELTIMILVGLLVYGISAFLSGSLNILLKSHLLKRKKDDVLPIA